MPQVDAEFVPPNRRRSRAVRRHHIRRLNHPLGYQVGVLFDAFAVAEDTAERLRSCRSDSASASKKGKRRWHSPK
jgi:uncharacterized protein YcgI (DUF1989 family)